jgi:hypothetical protein
VKVVARFHGFPIEGEPIKEPIEKLKSVGINSKEGQELYISGDVKLRYAYYASDNPLLSGETLASGSLGSEGVTPTYMITRAIVHKILNG